MLNPRCLQCVILACIVTTDTLSYWFYHITQWSIHMIDRITRYKQIYNTHTHTHTRRFSLTQSDLLFVYIHINCQPCMHYLHDRISYSKYKNFEHAQKQYGSQQWEVKLFKSLTYSYQTSIRTFKQSQACNTMTK